MNIDDVPEHGLAWPPDNCPKCGADEDAWIRTMHEQASWQTEPTRVGCKCLKCGAEGVWCYGWLSLAVPANKPVTPPSETTDASDS